jgi:2-methylcitrate dehydratase PrpD
MAYWMGEGSPIQYERCCASLRVHRDVVRQDKASPEAPHDKEALALAARVNVIADPEFDRLVDTTGALPAETTIELDGGRQLRHTLLDAPWGAGDPPSDDALTRKFLGMAEPILNGGASKLASAIMTLSGSEPASARDIMSLLH